MKALFLLLLAVLTSARLFHYQENMDLEQKSWFVMFAASWCQHCQKIKPQFLQAAVKSDFRFLMVDCEAAEDFCKAWGVKKYPTFKLITGVDELEYTGGRNFQDFLDYVTKAGKPAVTEIDLKDLETLHEKHEVSFTLFYADQSLKKTYEFVAEKYKHTHMWFYCIQGNSNLLTVSGSDNYLEYTTQDLTSKSIEKFIKLHTFPTLIEMHAFNMAQLSSNNRHKKLSILVVDPYDLDNRDIIRDYGELAYQYRLNLVDSIQFLILRGDEYEDKIEIYELKELPALIISEVIGDTVHFNKLEGPALRIGMIEFVYGVYKGDISLSELSPSYSFYIFRFFRSISSVEFWLDKLIYIIPFIVIVVSVIGSVVAMSGMNSVEDKEKEE